MVEAIPVKSALSTHANRKYGGFVMIHSWRALKRVSTGINNKNNNQYGTIKRCYHANIERAGY